MRGHLRSREQPHPFVVCRTARTTGTRVKATTTTPCIISLPLPLAFPLPFLYYTFIVYVIYVIREYAKHPETREKENVMRLPYGLLPVPAEKKETSLRSNPYGIFFYLAFALLHHIRKAKYCWAYFIRGILWEDQRCDKWI